MSTEATKKDWSVKIPFSDGTAVCLFQDRFVPNALVSMRIEHPVSPISTIFRLSRQDVEALALQLQTVLSPYASIEIVGIPVDDEARPVAFGSDGFDNIASLLEPGFSPVSRDGDGRHRQRVREQLEQPTPEVELITVHVGDVVVVHWIDQEHDERHIVVCLEVVGGLPLLGLRPIDPDVVDGLPEDGYFEFVQREDGTWYEINEPLQVVMIQKVEKP